MYCSIVSAIASTSSSSEYSWSEMKSGDLNSSRLRVLKYLLDYQNSRPASGPDDRDVVSNGSGYAILICWDGYAVLDRELDTPYPMEVDTLYSTVDQNSVWKSVGYGVSKSWIRRIDSLWIRRIDLYSSVVFGECRHGYAVSSLMDTAYWSSE
ncbi:hypothetical protein Tco_0842634 [Tanacetum coccineum]|uniref:Uncharacterized protein n=1 Tax=Tanacetum coccineum TaxID=301880 RepID=A0ABQ5B3B4_9ASTR